jgi:integrase
MDSLRLCDITPERIQHLISVALSCGYSVQTVTHIRNVVRAIFSHATTTGCYTGTNPVVFVTLPVMARKEAHKLTLIQLKQVIQAMRYPEKDIALFALLTELNVAEICGLQWKYVNLSNEGRLVDDECIPPRTIAVRNHSYRGEYGPVIESRKRFVSVPELLCSILRNLRIRRRFTEPHDFVLVSRSGTPVCPENIASRRLKSIGKSLELPWLSWSVFLRTRSSLRSQYGRHLHKEFETALPLNRLVLRHPLSIPARGQSQLRNGNW